MNKILHKNQFGFLKHSSTTSACANLFNEIVKSTNTSKKTSCIFIDLQKAFDSLNYEKLLKILKNYGICGKPLLLMKSYLTNRKQFVKINNTKSSLLDTTCGVPQGSILGPLLFNLYINDMLKLNLKGKAQLYADDCAIIYSENNFIDLKIP